jgi:hypothetical protein
MFTQKVVPVKLSDVNQRLKDADNFFAGKEYKRAINIYESILKDLNTELGAKYVLLEKQAMQMRHKMQICKAYAQYAIEFTAVPASLISP